MTQLAFDAYDSAGKRKYLTRNEGRDFLKAAAELALRERLFCETLFFLGCRISEAIRLTRDDLEATESVIRILCLKKRGKVVVRRVPVPDRLIEELQSLPATDDARLWPISRTTAWRIIKSVMDKAGISGVQATAKGLRHGLGVRSALANVPVSVIQRWLGHASPLTTATYLSVRDEEERKLIARTWT